MELILSIQISVLMLLLAGLFFINKNLASKIWTPFYQILEKVKEIEVNRDAELNLPKTNIREFEDLKQAILYLAKKNRRVYQVQKEFTENAAHEMQTPLAIFQSKLELLMQSMNLNEEQANLIESLLNVSQRLSRLNRSLLLLAKIENEQFIEKEEIDVCEVIQALIGQFSEQFRYQKIKSDIHLPNPIYLKANTTLLEILFSNLISNAIKYNLEQGIFLLNSNSRNEIIISNSGRLSAVHSADMFERFTKNASAQEGIGLGLAIVKKICDTCHYQIDYHFDDDLRLHHFKVKF
ncbi:sensor histidine kinase [Pseudarcicella hirudinis]